MSLKNIGLGIVLGIALAAGIGLSMRMATRVATPSTATVLPTKADIPQFSLLDQNGTRVGPSFFEGQWDLVFFGFTHCPDICPLTLQVLSAAKKQLVELGETPSPRIVLVSVDPERDTPETMSKYMSHFGDDNVAITGKLDELRKLTDKLGVYFEKRESDSEFYAVDHSATVFVIDPAGRYVALFSSPHKIENYVHDLPLLMSY